MYWLSPNNFVHVSVPKGDGQEKGAIASRGSRSAPRPQVMRDPSPICLCARLLPWGHKEARRHKEAPMLPRTQEVAHKIFSTVNEVEYKVK